MSFSGSGSLMITQYEPIVKEEAKACKVCFCSFWIGEVNTMYHERKSCKRDYFLAFLKNFGYTISDLISFFVGRYK